MPTGQPVILRGDAHRPGEAAAPVTVTLQEAEFSIAAGSAAPVSAGYRDITSILVDAGAVAVALGSGPGSVRWVFERFGTLTGVLVKGLRDGRFRQRLADGLVELPSSTEIELVEYTAGGETGIAQLAYDDRGATLAPLDDRLPWHRVRRADVGTAELAASVGGVAVHGAGRSLPPMPDGGPTLRLVRVGQTAPQHIKRWSALRDGTAADALAIVSALIPDASFGARTLASSQLLEGRPCSPLSLGEAWGPLEAAVLAVPPFDVSYGVLRSVGGGEAAPRWLACAPETPGKADDPRLWFFVGLPGNLVALELVSGGAHATYLFRVVPRSAWTGALPAGALETAVAEVSEALIDARFLREPMALPAAQLALPDALRYRLALAALPSLAAARARFVARLVHSDPATWEAALRDLVTWHGSCHDDAAQWPGGAAQEAQVDDAGGGSVG